MQNNTHILSLSGNSSNIIWKEIQSSIAPIESINYNESNHQLEIKGALNQKDILELWKKLADNHIQISSKKIKVPILEMTCAACASSVEQIIEVLPGIIQVQVNYASQSAIIEYLPDFISIDDLQKKLQSAGYDLVASQGSQARKFVEDNKEKQVKNLQKRVLWVALFSVPLFLIAMFFMHIPYANFIMWALSTPILFIWGKDFFIQAWKKLKNKTLNMDSLVALSTGTAYLFSVFNTLFPSFWTERNIEAHVYFEAAGIIIFFLLIGKWMEEKAKSQTSQALKKLIALQPDTLLRKNFLNQWEEISIEELLVGDIFLVKPGEKPAADGVVVAGSTYMDESMLSGEPIAVAKNYNDPIFAGTINQNASIEVRATGVGEDSKLASIIRMVEHAQGSKAPVQKLVDKISSIFVPSIIVISIISFILWTIFAPNQAFTHGLISMITVLVIACPCALGLATPTALMVGIGKAAENGILIKDATALEETSKINAIILDKTGTITLGKPKVQHEKWLEENEQWIQILKSIEQHSDHPLANAITAFYTSQKSLPIHSMQNHVGEGVSAIYNDEKYFVGKIEFLKKQGIIYTTEWDSKQDEWIKEGCSVIAFSNSKELLGLIAVSDEIKPGSKAVIEHLAKQHIDVFVLSGDKDEVVRQLTKDWPLKQALGNCSPEDKANKVNELKAQGKKVAMTGDGINDSAALAYADVSIAMGNGSDLAMDVSKATIISGDLRKIESLIRISKDTQKTIKQNLFWAFIYNIIGIPIAAGILYPINGFLLNPMIAGSAMALSSVSVVTNSLLLKFKK